MKENIIPAIRLTLFCAVFFSGIYTMSILGIAQLAPNQGNGEIVTVNGKNHHINVAQKFVENKYFWSRPSAVDYNAAGSGGSNKGTNNPDYLAEVETRIDSFLIKNPSVKRSEVPSELVTASGSGLDPNISVQGAKVQAKRIAESRKISEEKVLEIIKQNTEKPLLGMLGTEKINVLQLNIELDKLK
ncbi:K(+)-transporting ATPase subunit C [Flavobacterium aquatile]|uniref:Potassium-transporting ATPase KdpC subunit n=1 Tax=Flavobacterium aquatile LMG 4008 = ATCC 11947 TaxID=1453498 RepID=A0A095UW69_9FLAO|nr:K(+)-transporting ATPase subunit C [Flavobacterium aquatile]KGD66815.1 potassium-transporting ATPase subunit C [Flavobacterium aquatile LMG 4008 = ATCC 11947]OXA67908.1 potassium-transporting ATPase subunit C [Flavobacterium aquatile LMG 4008 = ATCC 11947]GEC78682.1 potassium-transporting ATPase KdpC subunit [Flavobacterium aquatile]